MNKIAALASIFLALGLTTLPGLAQTPSPAPGKNPGYRLGPRDLVGIKVYEVPELNVERRVTENGILSLPLVGDVKVAGKNEEELVRDLKALLESRYVNHASVEISVLEFRSRPISVIGAVKQPGNLAFSGRWTLVEALAAAGGLADNHGNVVHVLRRAENGLSDQVTLDLDDLLVRANPRINIPIFANDLINVPVTVERTVYCLGEVGHPGALVFRSTERLTLLAAIARAGGLTDRAAKKILIKRGQGADGPKELTVDYRRIVGGKDADPELGEGDVVVVKESFF
jgi:polysaccharide export outer membrane protein